MSVAGEIDRVLAGNPLRSSGGRTRFGEWDWLTAVPARTMRRLTGAGYFARSGLAIDEAVDLIIARVPGVETHDQAVAWYVRTALAELDARQAARVGEVAWEDQERPDWAHDDDVTTVDDDVVIVADWADDDHEIDWDASLTFEPAPRRAPGERATLYGSARPTRRTSAWDEPVSSPDVRLRRRWWLW